MVTGVVYTYCTMKGQLYGNSCMRHVMRLCQDFLEIVM